MFEKFTSENQENFRQRYEGTFGFFRNEDKKRLLVKIVGAEARRCTFQNADGIEFYLNPDVESDIGFEFLSPKSAWYNTADGAMFTQRLATRQFQRGITGKNTMIYLAKNGGLAQVAVNFHSLSKIFDSKFSKEDILSAFKSGKSIAISPSFALDESKGVVFLFSDNIGTYKRDGMKFQFKLSEPQLWKTEINDAIVALGGTTEIA